VALVKQAGAEAEGRLLWGKPADQIVELAEADGYEAIVMGHRGRGGLESLLLGSVAKDVIDQARCSVLVVR
jgi:nucleotide-binding universal stress UspA family protein